MITHIEGKLIEKTPTYAVIDCNGVGYFLNISLNTYSKIGSNEKCKLYSHIVVGMMDYAQVMYGFIDEAERTLFRHLISVSGVGANSARMFLSSFSPFELQQLILSGNVAALKSVKGIGEKTAQRLIIDLKDKLAKDGIQTETSFVQNNKIAEESLAALVMLGFNKNIAQKALDRVVKTTGNIGTVEELIKLALKNL